jgi:hypothetical protein
MGGTLQGRARCAVAVILGVVCVAIAPAPGSAWSGRPGAPSGDPAAKALALLRSARAPVSFEPNVGQSGPEVRWLARARGMKLFLTDAEAVLALGGSEGPEDPRRGTGNARGNPRPRPGGVLRMGFEGAAPAPRFEAGGRQPGVSNYFLGNDPSRWRTNVPRHDGVTMRGLWPGVDLCFHGDPARLEYDLLLAPGADPEAVRFRLTGPEAIRVDGDGDLVLSFPGGEVRQSAPVAWQGKDGERIPVASSFRLLGDGLLGFAVGARDPSRPLVIDPKIDRASYLGGNQGDAPADVTVDSSGNVIVAGLTSSTTFPLQSPFQSTYAGGSGNYPDDAFVTKYSPDLSSLVFSTYLGGNGFDDCSGVATDSSGYVHLVGITNSTNFPTASPLQASNAGGWDDMYIVKMAPNGASLSFSTYLGTNGADEAGDVAVDASGGIYVVGGTTSAAFPLTSPVQSAYGGGNWDAVFLKMNSSGSAVTWSTFYGGNGVDRAFGVAVDGSGGMYATGYTDSTNFPTKTPIQSGYAGGNGNFPDDTFVVKVAPSGTSIAYATYLGGGGYDECYSIAVNAAGEACLAGFTSSTNFPTASPYQASPGGGTDDAYVVKINAAGTALVFSTYLGGSGVDQAYGIGLDSTGAISVCGLTNSSNFPLVNAFQQTYMGGGSPFPDDAFVARFNAAGTVLYFSSYLQSNGFDDPGGLAVDGSGNAIVVGITSTSSYPVVNAVQSTYGGGALDGYVVRIATIPPAAPGTLTAQAIGSAPIQLAWTDNSADETGFEIERKTGATPFAKVTTTAQGTSGYLDYAVGPNTTYTYRVRAVNGDGPSGYTNEASAATGAIIPLPTAPGGLVAVVSSVSAVDLTWNDRSNNEISFEVQRRAETGPFALVASLPDGSTSWGDTGLAPGTAYTYRVRAVGVSGVSLYSAEAAATTFPTMTVAVAKGALTDSPKSSKDKLKVSGTFDFLPESPDAALDPSQEAFALYLVGEGNPLIVAVPAGDEGWKVKKGKYTWKSPGGSTAKVSVVIDAVKKTFTVTVSKIDFQAAPANPIRVTLKCGGDAGSQRVDWTLKKEGVFKYP